MAEKKYTWHKIAESGQELLAGDNSIAVVEVKGKKVCVARHQDNWYGFAYKCPHAGAPMTDGYIDMAGNVVCPLHRYKFSLRNGRNTSGEGYYLKTYPVQLQEDGLYMGMEEGGLFSWLS
ncbi:MAG: Rieske 2Fe-2S domain-containing protein [Candidatus Pseudobacter hemicellulosilyticus]|uniref:Rieske 2Fe-2S domain-containing protein n=1 Tax=Candidatus Pseudobacter hemicellulosilyticus TaxID=3121375 RepID=A0AAJ5WUY8_9BACT|nr:MAG: Rieske 2Fe-2S domain-containing protein [Pseudobacter sp.]